LIQEECRYIGDFIWEILNIKEKDIDLCEMFLNLIDDIIDQHVTDEFLIWIITVLG